MKLVAAALACLPLLIAAPAQAAVVSVTFDSVSSFASIGTHYAGGTDSDGVAGANLGVSFGLDALGLKNDALGPYFSNAPSPAGVMTVVGPAATMNVPAGFSNLSFFYSSNAAIADAIEVWSGLDGTGTRLASLSLANNAQAGGCSDTAFCNFSSLSTALVGSLGFSVSFGKAASAAAFDNLSLTVPGTVSEPGSVPIVALGLGLAALATRRRR
jgi:hypothetical protein